MAALQRPGVRVACVSGMLSARIQRAGQPVVEISIRRADPVDREVIAGFNAAMAMETEGKTLDPDILAEGVRRVLDDPQKGTYYLAVWNGQVIGQLMYTLEWSDWRNGWFWWIQSVYVDESCRGNGVFSRLYRYLADLAARTPDVCGLRLYVDNKNTRAQAAYRSLGMDLTDYGVMEMPLIKETD